MSLTNPIAFTPALTSLHAGLTALATARAVALSHEFGGGTLRQLEIAEDSVSVAAHASSVALADLWHQRTLLIGALAIYAGKPDGIPAQVTLERIGASPTEIEAAFKYRTEVMYA